MASGYHTGQHKLEKKNQIHVSSDHFPLPSSQLVIYWYSIFFNLSLDIYWIITLKKIKSPILCLQNENKKRGLVTPRFSE